MESSSGEMMKRYLALAFIGILLLSAGCTQQQQPMPGSDRDAHGCIPSAGYTWCDASQKCIRPWEENCTKACTQEAKICPDGSAVGRVGPDCEFAPCPAANNSGQIVGNDSDSHGCKGSAGYSWCETKQKCLRIWEEGCLNESDAREIAANSSCMDVGNLTADSSYNNYTNTWWIDLDTKKPGCAPACVVYEQNSSAEVNWRCTGLITPGQTGGSVMPGSDRDSHGCIPSAGYSWCAVKQKCYRPWEENCTTS
jgi:hypothetical protein